MIDNQENSGNQIEQFLAIEEIEKRHAQIAKSLKPEAIKYIEAHGKKDFVIEMLNEKSDLEAMVSEMRLVPGGQLFILEKLKETHPEITWYRAGTRKTFNESMSGDKGDWRNFFSEEDQETIVIDGHSNGLFGEPICVKNWFYLYKRDNPVIYSLTVADLEEGVKNGAIQLITEHYYDLRVVSADRKKYLQFCREKLKVETPPQSFLPK